MKNLACGGIPVCLAAAAFVVVGLFLPASAAPAPVQHQKSVDVSVSVVGNIEDVDQDEIEKLVEGMLEAGHIAVTDEDGPDVIEMHIAIALDDDGHGYAIHIEAGAWKGGGDIDDIDQIDEFLHTEVTEFEETIEHDE